jgi:predicted transcriptional regulator
LDRDSGTLSLVFTGEEEEFVNLLIKIDIRKTVAQTRVFLANTPEVTSRELERGTDLRQPEVSIAINYLDAQGWIQCRTVPSKRKGRPQKCYSRTKPVTGILAAIKKKPGRTRQTTSSRSSGRYEIISDRIHMRPHFQAFSPGFPIFETSFGEKKPS